MKRLPARLFAAVLLFVLGLSAASAQLAPGAETAPILPDAKLAPGDTLPVTLTDIQVRAYNAKVRNVPVSVKRQVYASYGIDKKYVSPTPLVAKKSASSYEPDTETSNAAPAAAGDGKVWVNTKSGGIWKPSSQYYGKAKAGRYMNEQEALAAGYHEAK